MAPQTAAQPNNLGIFAPRFKQKTLSKSFLVFSFYREQIFESNFDIFLFIRILLNYTEIHPAMSSSILHQCPHCGHASDISNALAAFIENPHCKQVDCVRSYLIIPRNLTRRIYIFSAGCLLPKATRKCKTNFQLCLIDK